VAEKFSYLELDVEDDAMLLRDCHGGMLDAEVVVSTLEYDG
jgi:hypothetical protein